MTIITQLVNSDVATRNLGSFGPKSGQIFLNLQLCYNHTPSLGLLDMFPVLGLSQDLVTGLGRETYPGCLGLGCDYLSFLYSTNNFA